MVKLERELLRLEQLGLLIWEACSLISGRPPAKNTTIRTVSTNNRSDENNCDQTKRMLGRSTIDATSPMGWEERSGGRVRAEDEWASEREMCPWAISKYFGDLVSNTSA
jgi:hypothetical protein